MIPMRTSSVFRSRWMALLWAAGIIWAAVDFVGSPDQSAAANQGDANQTVNSADQ
jgi:hypothetical protein